MYRGIKIEPFSLPVGLDETRKDYKIEILEKTSNVNKFWNMIETNTKFRIINLDSAPTSTQTQNQILATPYLSPSQLIAPKSLFEDFPLNAEYQYFKTIITEPIDIGEKIESTKRYPKFSFRDVFNYRPAAYIKYSSAISEIEAPNFYLCIEDEDNDKYINNFALNRDLDSRDIFEDVSNFKNASRERTFAEKQKTKNILLTYKANQYSDTERMRFPFAIDINFNFKDVDDITKKLNKYDLHSAMIEYLNTAEKQTLNLKTTNKNFNNPSIGINTSVECLDFYDFLKIPYFKKYDNFISLPDSRDKSLFSHNLNKIKSSSAFKNSSISFEEMISKQDSGSELLYLKIEKFIGKNAVGEPFQTFYLSGDNEVYKYFDTQVKNKSFYTYKITGIFLLHGVSYRFENNDDGTMSCISTPIKKIINHDFVTRTVFVLQPLQHPPDLHIYKHENKNKVFFYLRLNSENTKYIPFSPILQSDRQIVEILNSSKQYQDPEHSFTLEDARFQVFKSTTEPKSLEDMSESFLLDTKQIRERTDHLFIDKLEYGKEYYYLFRVLNGEGFPGNPTKLYKVKLEQGPEENKLKVEILDFKEEPVPYDIKKNFNQIFHIFPNYSQLIMTNLNSIPGDSYKDTLELINIGLEGLPSVWGKRFKLRITSNNTGKKIDFNVKFLIKRKNLEIE